MTDDALTPDLDPQEPQNDAQEPGQPEEVTQELEQERKAHEATRARLWRVEAAAAAGLDIQHIDRLRGDSPEELAEDARMLAGLLVKPRGADLGQADLPIQLPTSDLVPGWLRNLRTPRGV